MVLCSRLLFGIHHPEIFHGTGSKQHFEGWYFKIVDVTQSFCWVIIPGIYQCVQNPEFCQSFIMTLDGRTHKSTFHSFPAEDFISNDETTFDIAIGENRFSCNSISLNLPEIKGKISFENLTGWPVTCLCPGIMGWTAYFPLECYHGLLSMDHGIHGSLTQNDGEILDFEGGRGYIEKDWGTNFPKCWVWIQANHFLDSEGTSISISIARVPFYKLVFPGFIVGFLYEGILHRFTKYACAKLDSVKVNDDIVVVEVSNRTHRLKVVATRATTAILHMPTKDYGMIPKIDDSIGSIVTVQFFKGDSILFEGTSQHGGLEVFGDYEMLLR